MDGCIFCDLIKENDPVKIPEQGKDYSIIKGKFVISWVQVVKVDENLQPSSYCQNDKHHKEI